MKPYIYVIKPKRPFMYTEHLASFSIQGLPTPILYSVSEKSMRTALRLEEGLVGVEAVFRKEPWSSTVYLKVYAPVESTARNALSVFKKIIRADLDYNAFMANVKRVDEKLYCLARRHPGLRPGRCLSLYVALIDSIVKQRISLKAALRIYASLVKDYGGVVEAADKRFYWHPLPENLFSTSIHELRAHGLTKNKARALKEIALAALEERLPREKEAVKNPGETIDELTKLYGVGPWTAQLALAMISPLFPVGPVADMAVRRGLAIIYRNKTSVDKLAGEILGTLRDYGGLILYLAAHEYELKKQGQR